MKKAQIFIILFVTVVVLILTTPVEAQPINPPAIKIAPVWRTPETLTSVNSNGGAFPSEDGDANWEPGGDDDDVRYAEVDINVTTSVEFWTAQVSCKVSPAILEAYIQDLTGVTADPQDNLLNVDWGGLWGWYGSNFTEVIPPYNPATGEITFVATRMGSSAPMGRNGQDFTFLLAILRFRVKTQLPAFTTGISTLSCTATFLNRDGRPVVPAVAYLAPPPLKVIAGYTLEGVVRYQGRINHSGIGVFCDPNGPDAPNYPADPAAPAPVRTDVSGKFKINTRLDDWFGCSFYGNITSPESPTGPPAEQPDLFLSKSTWTILDHRSYLFLPVTLPAGNVERGITATFIGIEDLALVTGNWNATVLTNTSGDASGDGKINQIDLALVSSNLYKGNYVNAEHLIISGQLSASSVYPDNRLHMADAYFLPSFSPSLNPSQLVPGNNRDFWPAISPDGRFIAYSRAITTGTGASAVTRYAIYVQNADGSGAATRLTPAINWNYDVFAPSWSTDGAKIAFICSRVSQNYQAWIWANDQGNLCVMDANGQNLSVLLGPVKIYPPAWWWNHGIVVAGTANNGICPGTLCLIDIYGNWYNALDSSIPSGADMPSIFYGRLLYRYDNGATRVLRMATLDYDGDNDSIEPYTTRAAAPSGGCCNTEYHTEVTYYNGSAFVPFSTNVQYYARRDDSIVLYETWPWNLIASSFSPDAYDYFDPPKSAPTWDIPVRASLNGLYSNPYWNGNANSSTGLFALRVTLTWQP